jgi:RNA polymerase sigma factor (sigma-70 family)
MTKVQKKHILPPSLSSSPKALGAIEKRRLESREEDSLLIKRALAGDQKAFRKLRLKYYDAIFKLVNRMIRNREEVEDLTQEAFIKAFTSLERFDNQYSFSTWLYKIATNNSIDHIRKKKLQTFSINKPIESEESDYSFELPDTNLEPDQELIASQRKKMLDEAMNALPPKYRQVILMRHVDEKEYQEIAKTLKLPLGTIKAHIFRARELLYKQLRDKMRHY